MKRILLGLLLFFPVSAIAAPASNEVALEIPSDGGVMLMYGKSWRVSRFVYAGFMAGGGQINRDFDLKVDGQPTRKATSETLILPMVGPRVTFVFPIIAISVGYAGFYGSSDLTVKDPMGDLSGKTKGWGTGFYSPLLSLDVYNEKKDFVFGVGIGGFLGTSFPDLEASGHGTTVRTTENPIDTLTFHLKFGWDDGRRERLRKKEDLDDF